MKNILYIALLAGGMLFINESKAQVNVSINIGTQPLWGPVGYEYARFYYLPEIDVYYNVASRKYVYWQGKKWVTKSKLPARYRHVDLFRTYKVVINDPDPWRYHVRHRDAYARYAHVRNQVVIRDVHHHHKPHKPTPKPKHKHDRRDRRR